MLSRSIKREPFIAPFGEVKCASSTGKEFVTENPKGAFIRKSGDILYANRIKYPVFVERYHGLSFVPAPDICIRSEQFIILSRI